MGLNIVSIKKCFSIKQGQDYVKGEFPGCGRPQRIAPTGFRRGRSPCLPENLTFWATLTHPCKQGEIK
jgi:hypothetical protein